MDEEVKIRKEEFEYTSNEERMKYEGIRERFKALTPSHLLGIHRIYFEKYLKGRSIEHILGNPHGIYKNDKEWNLNCGILKFVKGHSIEEPILVYDTGYVGNLDDETLSKIERDFEIIKSIFTDRKA